MNWIQHSFVIAIWQDRVIHQFNYLLSLLRWKPTDITVNEIVFGCDMS